jgi:hypothetical protein
VRTLASGSVGGRGCLLRGIGRRYLRTQGQGSTQGG